MPTLKLFKATLSFLFKICIKGTFPIKLAQIVKVEGAPII